MNETFLHRIVTKIFAVCGAAFFIFAFWYSFQNVSRNYESTAWLVLNILFFALMVALLFCVFTKIQSTKGFIILLLLLGGGARIWWIVNINTVPHSDFSIMYEAAKHAAAGNFSFTSYGYFQRWPYQHGFTLYEALLMKVFGENLYILKLFNIFFSLGNSLIIYVIARKLFNEPTGKITSLLYTFYIPNIIYCSVLTNQHISTFFFLLALYFLVVNGFSRKYSWIMIGILLGLGNLMRPTGDFFTLAMIVYVFIYKVLPLRKKEGFTYVKKLVGVVAVYILFQQFISMSLIYGGIASQPLSSQDPYWKFAVGLNQDTIGRYSRGDDIFVSQFSIGEERNNAEIEMIKERIEDKGKLVSLLYEKFKLFWGATDASVYWALQDENQPALKHYLTKLEQLSYLTITLFGIGVIFLFKRMNTKAPLFVVLLVGYALIHLFVEIQTRYRFDILPVVFILAGYGISNIVYLIIKRYNRLVNIKMDFSKSP